MPDKSDNSVWQLGWSIFSVTYDPPTKASTQWFNSYVASNKAKARGHVK